MHKDGKFQDCQLMTKEIKNKIVPEFRFPEFVNDKEWEEKFVEDFFLVGSSKRVLQEDWTNQGIPFYRTRELVSLSKNEPFGSEIFISEELFSEISEKYGLPSEGDFLVSGVGTLGICYQVQANDKFYFKDGNVLWFKIGKGLDSTYFKYCFQSQYIQKQIFGQASISTVGTYTIQNAKKTTLWYPPTINEQQKIAGCLSSLDDLITAQSQKFEALKAHKKGLMQQLFPAEGETVPKLRFEEFRESGEWHLRKLDQVAAVARGKSKHRPRDADFLYGGVYPFIQTGDIRKAGLYLTDFTQTYSEAGLKQSKLWDEDTLCITIAANIAETAILKIKACFPDSIIGVIPKANMTTVLFLKYLFDNFKMQIQRQSQGMAQDNLNQEKLLNIDFIFPDYSEQQKIADCLSSLDELITAQTEKIEELKRHKKGLMQGLFPVA